MNAQYKARIFSTLTHKKIVTNMPASRGKFNEIVHRHALTVLTLAGAIIGIVAGFVLRAVPKEPWWSAREVMYFSFVGELYLRMLTMFVIPLLVTAVVSGIASLDLQASWKIAARAAVWFVTIQYIAVVIGITCAVAIRPGIGISNQQLAPQDQPGIMPIDRALDIFRNIFPQNFVETNLKQERTVLERNDSLPIEEWKITLQSVNGVNIPGLLTLGIILGLSIGISMPAGRPMLDIFDCLGRCMMMGIRWVLWLTPIAVCFMVTSKLLSEQNLTILLERLGLYFVTVLVGLFIHGFMAAPLVYFALTRKSPFKLIGSMMPAFATSFGTASSNATLPVMMECMEKRAGLDGRLVRFLAPVSVTLNMDGTALYEAVAVVFISQLRGVYLDFTRLFVISITVTAACLGSSGVPQAGLVTMVLILGSLGLPAEDVTLIVAIDWLLDRFRTTVNVMSDSLGAGVIEHLSQDQLAEIGRRKYSRVPENDEGEELELNIRL